MAISKRSVLHGLTLHLLFLRMALCARSRPGKWRQLPGGVSPDSMYYYSHRDDTVSETERIDVCNSDVKSGSWLVNILSAEENYGINDAFPGSRADRNDPARRYYWIGLLRDTSVRRARFQWSTLSSDDTCYVNWLHHRPDYQPNKRRHRSNYVYFDFGTGGWESAEGSVTHHFICEAPNSCMDYCNNGGTCELNEDTGEPLRCTCPSAYTGTRCESLTACVSNVCRNGGTCSDRSGMYECTCTDSYTGVTCEQDVDECDDSVVFNYCPVPAGRCINTHGGYNCEGFPGRTGTMCVDEVRSCDDDDDVCRNGGTCSSGVVVDNSTSINCQCAVGYEGTYCERGPFDCMSNPCNNGAICTQLRFGGYTCACTESFTGQRCDTDVDECTTYGYCSGYTCRNLIGSYECDGCPVGFTKPQCTTDINECLTNHNSCYGRGRCVNTVGSYICRCLDGFDAASFCALPTSACGVVAGAQLTPQAAHNSKPLTSSTDVLVLVIIVIEAVVSAGVLYKILIETIFTPLPRSRMR